MSAKTVTSKVPTRCKEIRGATALAANYLKVPCALISTAQIVQSHVLGHLAAAQTSCKQKTKKTQRYQQLFSCHGGRCACLFTHPGDAEQRKHSIVVFPMSLNKTASCRQKNQKEKMILSPTSPCCFNKHTRMLFWWTSRPKGVVVEFVGDLKLRVW